MESFFPTLEALFDKRTKHPVLLVDAVEESANVTLPAEIASGEMYGMTLVCHISPHMHSRYETESRIANALTTMAPFPAIVPFYEVHPLTQLQALIRQYVWHFLEGVAVESSPHLVSARLHSHLCAFLYP